MSVKPNPTIILLLLSLSLHIVSVQNEKPLICHCLTSCYEGGGRCHRTGAAIMLHFLPDLSYLLLCVVYLYGFMTWPDALWVMCSNIERNKSLSVLGCLIQYILIFCCLRIFFGNALPLYFPISLRFSLNLSLCQISEWEGETFTVPTKRRR